MIDRLKLPFITISSIFIVGWMSLKIFTYFTCTTPPQFTLKGIEQNGSYTRTVECSVDANNDYKVSEVNVKVDNKPIFNQSVRSKNFQAPFAFDTSSLTDGLHTMEVTAIDSSYHHNVTQKKYQFFVDNTPLHVAFDSNEYTVDQGKTLHMKMQANKQLAKADLQLFGKTYSFYPTTEQATSYECFIPIDCEENPNEYTVTTNIEDPVKNKVTLNNKICVRHFEFKKQRGFTVSEDKLSQEKEVSMGAKILNEALDKWLQESPHKKSWNGPFEYPVEVQRITTPFGEVRMTPERGRHQHKGLDLINQPKSVIWAAQHGKVIIKDRFFLTGNTVVIDHGLGVFTLYAHLDSFADIEIGDMIKKGSPVGKLGMTGYATGYHLHWELRVNNVPVDPTEWTSKIY